MASDDDMIFSHLPSHALCDSFIDAFMNIINAVNLVVISLKEGANVIACHAERGCHRCGHPEINHTYYDSTCAAVIEFVKQDELRKAIDNLEVLKSINVESLSEEICLMTHFSSNNEDQQATRAGKGGTHVG